MKKIIFLIICTSITLSDINVNGDARLRPRLDLKTNGDNTSTADLYYLYRARLNISSNIGGGWFFKSRIGTNDASSQVKMGVDGPFSNSPGLPNASRPALSFLNLYFGIKGDDCGLWGGAIPLKHNPALDIHFHADKVVDIPWAVFNNSSTTGFAGYIKRVNWFISIDGNNEEIGEGDTETVKRIDPVTLGLDFNFKWNEYLDMKPRILVTIANQFEPWPMTFGLDMKVKPLFKINSMLSVYTSMQIINEDYKYQISHTRFKFNRELGPGELNFWFDMASYVDQTDSETDLESSKFDLMYFWLDYDYDLFNGDFGSVSLKPTFRYQMGKVGDSDYSRVKLELTAGIKFE